MINMEKIKTNFLLTGLVILFSIFLTNLTYAEFGVGIYNAYYSSAHVSGVFGDYYDNYDLEYGGYITGNNSTLRSGLTAYLIQGNLKTDLGDGLKLLYGLSFEILTNGESLGVSYSGNSFGPFIGLEHALSNKLRMRAIYHPVYFTSLDVAGVKTSITDFGLNGAFGLVYIF